MTKNIQNFVEITDAHVKYLQVKDGVVLIACRIEPIRTHTDEEIVVVLKSMAAGKDPIVAVIARRFIIMKTLRFPSHEEEEIRKMAGLQLVQQTPYAIEDVLFDIQVLEKEPAGYARVNVLIVHKEVADRYFRIFEKAGIKIEHLALSSYGLTANFQEERRNSLSVDICVDIDTAQTEVCFFKGARLFYSRHIPYGFRDLNGEHMPDLVNQIVLSYKSCRKEHDLAGFGQLFLLSPRKEYDSLKKDLELKLQISVATTDFLSQFKVRKKTDMEFLNNTDGVSLSALLGLSKLSEVKYPRFIPQKVHEKRQRKIRRVQFVQLETSLIIFALVLITVFGVKYQAKRSQLDSIKAKNASWQNDVDQAKQKMDRVQFFEKELKGRILVADLVEELMLLLPAEVSLRSIQLDESGLFSVQGYAETAPSVNVFQENLVKSATFKEVSLQFATKRRIFNQDLTDFKITTRITKTP
jgi:hypothetical protein